jgi:hypothetical protein
MGSQGGGQRHQTPGDAYRHPATIVQVKWLIRRRQTTVCDDQNSPEKRKVGSSTLPLTTSFGLVSSALTSANAYWALSCLQASSDHDCPCVTVVVRVLSHADRTPRGRLETTP